MKDDNGNCEPVATPTVPGNGTSGTLVKGRSSGEIGPTGASTAANSPAPCTPADASVAEGSIPAIPNKKGESSDGGCVSGTKAPATEVVVS